MSTRRTQSRKTQSTHTACRDEMRNRLLRVVEEMLDNGESFTEISVERMVSAAGTSRSTFYVYFEDKGDLLRAWFTDITSDVAQAVAGWWEIDKDSTRDDLRAALANAVAVYQPHASLMAATFDAAAYDQSVGELTGKFMSVSFRSLREHIRKGQEAGFVDPSLSAAEVAKWLAWMSERAFHMILRGVGSTELQRQIDAYTSIVWDTLYQPTRTP